MLVDSHCHLTSPPLRGQLAGVLGRAVAAGVGHVVTIGTDPQDARAALSLPHDAPRVWVAAGVHPHESAKVTGDWLAELDILAGDARVVALGEMGLDYHYDFSPRQRQQAVFAEQLGLADRLGTPVVIHCREAHADCVSILSDLRNVTRVVFHCFTGTAAEADDILSRGWWISLTGVVTFKNARELADVARRLPPDQFMIETDAPYLSPEPVRHVRPNEPAHVAHIARRLAEIRDVEFDELAALTAGNAARFFGWPVR